MIIIFIISFVLDGIVSLLLSKNSLLLPLLSLMSLIIVYSNTNKKTKLIYSSIILGYLYDVIYTQTPFLNTIIFALLACFIIIFYKYVPCNIVSSSIICIITIILYRVFTYSSFVLINDYKYEFYSLFVSIYSSIILNYLYFLIFNLIFRFINNNNKKHFQQNSTFVR